MPMRFFFSPAIFGTEISYTLIIMVFCLLIYIKTREIYDLTKHKGIQHFRVAFLFFALAYASRLFLHLLLLGGIAFDFFLPGPLLTPLSNMVLAYFSTMAMLFLLYSIMWKKIQFNHFIIASNVIAFVVSIIALLFRSHQIILIFQIALLLVAVVLSLVVYRNQKKISNIRILYFLLFIFWILSLFTIGTGRLVPLELRLATQLLSIIIFIVIYYKVSKWTK